MIHEGTHGIQALDLLGRKVVMDGGKGLQLLAGTINATIQRALAVPELAVFANELAAALAKSAAPPRPPGRPAWPRRRYQCHCPTCRPSAHGDRLDLARRGAVRAREAGAGRCGRR